MAVRTLPFLLVITFGVSLGNAGEIALSSEAPRAEQESAPDPRLLRETFQGQFNKEQLAQFKAPPTIEQLVERMTSEQKQGARMKLAELERSASTPADLDEIAKGYLMLDEKSSDAGQQAIRIATQLQQMEPENSRGFALAASGFHQSGDYPAAAEWAKKALELNPNDERARAVYMLSVGRVKRSGAGLPGVVGTPAMPGTGGFASLDWDIPVKDASPEAITLMKQAVAARRAGNMDEPMRLAQEAMRRDPGSLGVQKFYALVEADHRKHADTLDYLRRSREAMDAGNGAEAVSWAQKAYERSGDATVYKILGLAVQQNEKLAAEAVRKDLEARKKKPKKGLPLWPVGAGLGLAAIGYGIAKSKSSWSAQESEPPEDEDPNSERIQQNRHRFKVAAISAAIGFGVVYGVVYAGPWLVGTAGPAVAAMLRGNTSLQRTLASQAGVINPGEIQQAKNAAQAGERFLLGIRSPQFVEIAEQIGARHLLYDKNWQETLKTAIANPATRFTISLDGFSGANAYSKLMGAAQRGLTPAATATEWEIAQLYQAGRLSQVAIIEGGKAVQNPFVQTATR